MPSQSIRTRAQAAVLVVLPLLGGCLADPFTTRPFYGEFAFQVTDVAPAPADPPETRLAPVEAFAEGGTLVVTGAFVTACDEALMARPGYVRPVHTYVLEFTAHPANGTCSSPGRVVQTWRSAMVMRLGTHRLRVHFDDEVWSFNVTTY